jgi:hypothetical protein
MRQLLMLGFYCEVYRREPLCRIYVNDVLVDEFDIPHSPFKDSSTPDMKLDPTHWTKEQLLLQFNPPFLKFLELDDAGKRSLDLRVEIQNNDNNYANGFMTQYSRVMLCQCWLAPVKVWEEFDQIADRWKFSKRNWQKYFGYKKIINYYLGLRNNVVDSLAIYANLYFPDIVRTPRSTEQQKSYFSNYQNLPRIMQDEPARHWIGSSGYFHLTLVKKLGFWRHSTDRRRGWWKIAPLKNVKDLYDKYKQYEDTRSTDT